MNSSSGSGFGSGFGTAPAPEAPDAWQATRAQTSLATQIMQTEDDYLAPEKQDIGRQTNANERELFVSCAPDLAMQQQFEHLHPEFIAVHDIATASSRKLLAGIAAASGRAVQKLIIRRQGYGTALATLEFVELPTPDGSLLRMYSTEVDADTAARHGLARVLLGFSRLGVVMVGELPGHSIASALKPFQDAMISGPWPNRELLLLPLASGSALAAQGAELARGTGVNVRTTPQVTRPADAWGFINGTWGRLRDGAAPAPDRRSPTSPGAATRSAAAPTAAAAARPSAEPRADAPDADRHPGRRPRRRAAQPARPLRAPAQRAAGHGELLHLRRQQRPRGHPRRRQPRRCRPGDARQGAARRHEREQPHAGPGPHAARGRHHARLAPPAAARRARPPGPGAACGAGQDPRQPDARALAGSAHGFAVRERPQTSLSGRRARSRTCRPRSPPGSRPSARSALRGSASRPGSRCAAGSRASAAARRTPGRNRPWPARPAPRRHLELHVHLLEPRFQHLELDLRDRLDVLRVERVEHHRLVDAVQELRAEVLLDLGPDRVKDRLAVPARPSA